MIICDIKLIFFEIYFFLNIAFCCYFFIALINNGLVLMNVGTHWQDIMMGVIMIFAVYMDLFKKKKSQMVRVKE